VITRTASVVVASLTLALSACGSGAGPVPTRSAATFSSSSTEPIDPAESAAAASATGAPTEPASAFPVAVFAAIPEDPLPAGLAAELQAALALHDVTGGGGMSATVMTAEGAWSGTTGKADGVRDVGVDDQFAIASITKSVVAAQVMLMVEAGELGLDDLVADHVPADLRFDTNAATIRDLLGHRSGIPDYYDLLDEHAGGPQTEFQRVWTPTEILAALPTERTPSGSTFAYAETNFLLLSLVIEHVRGRPLADVLRDGGLAVDGLQRLVYQPDQRPTEPMAMPAGASSAVLEIRGGYLPSLAAATAYHASGAIASDARSLARWWRALCAGEIVSQASLTEMSTFEPAAYLGSYGLGVYNPANGYAEGFGHTGQLPGYMSWAACLPKDGAVIVVLTNHEVVDGHLAFSHGLARPLVNALRTWAASH
jgi:D-alanyl-D-alanine carboxypeptidase